MPSARMAALTAALALLATAPAHAAPGDLDPTFGGDGRVTAAPGTSATLSALTLSGRGDKDLAEVLGA